MPQRAPAEEAMLRSIFELLSAHGEGAPSEAEKKEMLQRFRQSSDRSAGALDEFLIRQFTRCQKGMAQAQAAQHELKEIVTKLTCLPWLPAIFLGFQELPAGKQAVVFQGNERRIVGLAPGVDAGKLRKGDCVLLSHERNAIMASASPDLLRCGDTAIFDRRLDDGRIIIKWRDEEMVVEAAEHLEEVPLKSGDTVRWDRNLLMAFEKIDRSRGEHFFLEDTPKQTFADIGGLDDQIAQLQRVIVLHRNHPETVSRYDLARVKAVLLVGPTGTGKTMMARALANWLATLSPVSRSRFIHIKPGAMNSVWYGQSEANWRDVFRSARDAAAEDGDIPVVMYIDEVDSIGFGRGIGGAETAQRVDERVQNALMSELDGLESRGNILVVAATNRPEVLDPALMRPGRLGDRIIQVPRPNRNGARAIFAKYLKPHIPCASNGHGDDGDASRWAIIDAAISRAYSPNGDGALATVTFRDGKQRTVHAGDLINGSLIAGIVQLATEKACLRDIETKQVGVSLEDVLTAMSEELESAARILTPWNCHKHLAGLPQDMPVASVEPVVRKVSRPHRFLRLDALSSQRRGEPASGTDHPALEQGSLEVTA